jgi:hypothetical protein
LRRIEDAITYKNESKLRWARAVCETRKKFMKRHNARWYHLENRIRAVLGNVERKAT